MSDEIEPLNPDACGPIHFSALKFTSYPAEVWAGLEGTDPNDRIHIEWTNATLTMRAASVRALLELNVER